MKTIELIQKIHATPHKAVLAITGGGTGAINELLQYGGGSATVLEAAVPYDQNAFDRFVKGHPDRYCSPEAARDLAMAAYQRGITFDTDPDHVVGIGATCSLMKNEQEREGREHHVYIGIQTRKATRTLWYKIDGNFANRVAEEKFSSFAIIDALASVAFDANPGILLEGVWKEMGEKGEAKTLQSDAGGIDYPGTEAEPKAGISRCVVSNLLKQDIIVEDGNADGRLALSPLLDEREKHFVEFGSDMTAALRDQTGLPRIILSGSFRPLHQGHIDMAQAGQKIYGSPVDLEICVHNVDKPTLNYGEMVERVDALKQHNDTPWKGSTLLTNAATFVEKAEMFPTAKFLVGFDTLKRIGMEKYYYNRHHMLDCFRRIKELGCVFVVFHRMTNKDGVVDVSTQRDFDSLPNELKEISFVQSVVPTAISSSEIRNGHA
jgi:hypothetical protein